MDYKLISSSATEVHLQFRGTLNNIALTWDAKIRTLQSIILVNPEKGVRQYIDIAEQDTDPKPISIGLNVQTISKPEILKTIIMITNYKKLKPGRLEYGAFYFFKHN